MKKNTIIGLFFSLTISLLIFWQFFIKGLLPFPGNYLLAWYEPWKTDHTVGKTIKIAHKPVVDDAFRYLYPFKVLGMESFQKLELPLWNPYNGSGMPFFATIQSGFLNPLNIIFLFLENRLAWTLYIILQALLLTFFTYLYCRKIKLSVAGSLFATTVFLFSGFVIARLIFGNIVYPLILLPLILYLIEDGLINPKSKKVFLVPIAIALLFFVGHPHILFYVFAFSILYFLYRFFTTQKGKKNKILFLCFFTFFLIGIGLSGVQIIPTLELLGNANINPESSRFIFERFLLPPYHLISILIPNYFGNRATYNYWGAGDYMETIASIGIIPCFFAYIAFIKGHNLKKDIRPFFFMSMLVTILSTLNWFLPKLLFSLPIPVITTSPPSRIFALTIFSIAILAGYGFDRWLLINKNDFKEIKNNIIGFSALISIIFIATLLFYILNISCNNEFILNCRSIALRNTLAETGIFVVALFLFSLYILNANKKIRNIIPFGIILLVLGIGMYNSNKFLPFSKKETILPQNNLINELQKRTRDARVIGLGGANLKTDFATYFKLYDPNYYDPLYNKRYGELVSFANLGKSVSVLQRSDIEITNDTEINANDNDRRNRLFDLLSVKYLIFKKSGIKNYDNKNLIWQDKNWILTQNPNSLPRAYTVSNYEIINDKEKLLTRLFDPKFDPKKNVTLEKNLPNIKYSPINNNYNQINITDYEENKVKINSNAEENEILVLTDNYYPGWKAYIDGKETQIYRANYTLRAISIPKGNHNIEFYYQPGSLKIGGIISIASLILLLFIFFRPKKEDKKS